MGDPEEKLFKAPEQKKAEKDAAAASRARAEEEKPKEAEEKEEEEAAKEPVKREPEKKAEEKKEKKEEKEPEEEVKKREIVLERVFVVPLGKAFSKPLMKRGPTAVRLLREFICRHLKAAPEKVRLEPSLVNKVCSRGSPQPLKKVKVLATKDKEGVVVVAPA